MTLARSALPILFAFIWFPACACAQGHDHGHAPMPTSRVDSTRPDHDREHMATMGMGMGMDNETMATMSDAAMLHMKMTPRRAATHADSARAMELVVAIREAISKYRDPAAAEADGFRMFLPNVKHQREYHFTNYRNAFVEAFRFDPARPTSILYKPDAEGKLRLVGAMYTAPKRTGEDKLNDRIPLSIARWHVHTNWCLPKKGETRRWAERRDGKPLFGPESTVATKSACDEVDGDFHASIFGWMTHVNVYDGHDLATIFGEGH